MAHKTKHHKKVIHHHHNKDESHAYVRLDNSIMTRKELLQTAIESAQILKDWETYKLIRELKLEAYKKVVFIFNKIEREMSTIKRKIPKFDNEKYLGKPVTQKVEEERVGEVQEKKIYKTELDKEIDEIRDKINALGI